jgi:hypothetical protein
MLHTDRTQEVRVQTSTVSRQVAPSNLDTMQPDSSEDEFEEITDKLSRVILVTSILDINEMIIEEQWKRKGGNGSPWEQDLVKHKGELQQGLTEVKGRLKNGNDQDEMVMDVTTIPTIIVQEPDAEDDRKLAGAFEGAANFLERQKSEVPNPPKTPATPSSSQKMTGDFDSSGSLSTIIDLETEPQAANPLPPSPHQADTTQEFAILIKDLLGTDTDVEQPNSMQIEIELQTKAESAVEATSVDQSTTIIDSNANMADAAPINHSATQVTTQPTALSSTEVARGHKRGSDEAGLDEQSTSSQLDAAGQDEDVETPPKKRNGTEDRKMSDVTRPHTFPKTPGKGGTPRAKPKATPSALRRSRRKH